MAVQKTDDGIDITAIKKIPERNDGTKDFYYWKVEQLTRLWEDQTAHLRIFENLIEKGEDDLDEEKRLHKQTKEELTLLAKEKSDNEKEHDRSILKEHTKYKAKQREDEKHLKENENLKKKLNCKEIEFEVQKSQSVAADKLAHDKIANLKLEIQKQKSISLQKNADCERQKEACENMSHKLEKIREAETKISKEYKLKTEKLEKRLKKFEISDDETGETDDEEDSGEETEIDQSSQGDNWNSFTRKKLIGLILKLRKKISDNKEITNENEAKLRLKNKELESNFNDEKKTRMKLQSKLEELDILRDKNKIASASILNVKPKKDQNNDVVLIDEDADDTDAEHATRMKKRKSSFASALNSGSKKITRSTRKKKKKIESSDSDIEIVDEFRTPTS